MSFKPVTVGVLWVLLSMTAANAAEKSLPTETQSQLDARMKWFREARFGLFIHWGVYSVPAGEWKGNKSYGEWFLEETKMPVSQYEKFAQQFNPVKFDAKQWVRDGQGRRDEVHRYYQQAPRRLWDVPSEMTDWCIKSTPFQRDPLKELAAACKEAGITLCFYHSIMDWHHPDWGTRRPGTTRPRQARHGPLHPIMKGQLKELLTNYGPIGILWFDGEWEVPWTHERGVDLYSTSARFSPTSSSTIASARPAA